MCVANGPLILLSPAKSLAALDAKLPPALAAIKPSSPRFLSLAKQLATELGKKSKADIKALMGLSDSLATLNHARFSNFESQPARPAVCCFEGAAYKGLDARSLTSEQLTYCDEHLRILCGLYGVLRPNDAIRPYRLEMSTKLTGPNGEKNLYEFWGEELTKSIEAEKPAWVLNVASQEYAKGVDLKSLKVPLVVTASFPGPAIHAKTARGEMVRFCAEQRVTRPEALRDFRGSNGIWSFVPGESSDTNLVFKRGSASGKDRSSTESTAAKKRACDDEVEEGAVATAAGRKSRRK